MQSENNAVSIKTDANNVSKKAKVMRNHEVAYLCDTISQEITSFQKKSGIPGLYQSAIIVDVLSNTTSHDLIQECSAHIRQNTPGWALKILGTRSQSGLPAIFNCISNSSVVKAVAKTGAINIPSLISKLTGVITFLAVMILFVIFSSSPIGMIHPTVPIVFMAFCSAITVGYLIYWTVQNRTVSKYTIPLDEIQKITLTCGKVAENFYDAVANEVSGNLPLVILIEDISAIDNVSSCVVRQILSGKNINGTGALLWVAFDTMFKSADTTFTNCEFSVKRYAMIQEES